MKTRHDKYLGLITEPVKSGMLVYIPKASGYTDFLFARINYAPSPAPGWKADDLVYRELLVIDNKITWDNNTPNHKIKQTGFVTAEKLVQFLAFKITQDFPEVTTILKRLADESKLRKNIRKKLQEAVKKVLFKNPNAFRKVTYPDIAGWRAHTDGKDAYNIYADTPEHPVFADRKGRLVRSPFGSTFLLYTDFNGKDQSTDWNFANLKNAVRFVFMQNQKPLK